MSPHPCASASEHQPPQAGRFREEFAGSHSCQHRRETGKRKERGGAVQSRPPPSALPAPCVTGCGCCQRGDEATHSPRGQGDVVELGFAALCTSFSPAPHLDGDACCGVALAGTSRGCEPGEPAASPVCRRELVPVHSYGKKRRNK